MSTSAESTGAASELLVERDGPVATLVMNRPQRRNAITVALWQRIADTLTKLANDDEIRVVIFRGAGREAFSAGADISEFPQYRATAEQAKRYNERVGAVMEAIAHFPKPTISLIYGFCIGGGCELAIATDLRYAAENAQIGIPAAKLGIGTSVPDVRRLVARVGPGNAREILYSGRRFDAQRALTMGLWNVVTPIDQLEATVRDLALEIAANAPSSIRWSKRAIRAAAGEEGPIDLTSPELAIEALFDTEDYREAVQAFLEKRPPRFTGR